MIKHLQKRTINCSHFSGFVVVALALCLLTSCSNKSRSSRPSPLRKDSTQIATVNAKINYSSPGVKKRKIFGKGDDFLVPFGKVWRTGANEATCLSLDGPVLLDGYLIESGKYALLTIPDRYQWTVIINSDWDQWGAYNYTDSLDVLRLNVPVHYEVVKPKERLQFTFRNDSLIFQWDVAKWSLLLEKL